MINNGPSQSVKSIAWYMGVFDFLIWLVVYEDIWYFLYNIRKAHY